MTDHTHIHTRTTITHPNTHNTHTPTQKTHNTNTHNTHTDTIPKLQEILGTSHPALHLPFTEPI